MDEEMEVMCETMDILLEIDEAILEGEPKSVKHEYFESDNDPLMEEFPEFLETDLRLLSDTMIELNNLTRNEKEFQEIMEHLDSKTEGIKPEDTEFYVEGVVMKKLYDKGKIKSKMMFRRETESD
jgi:hypothetical protein